MKTIIDKEAFFQDKVTTAYSDRVFKDYQERGKQAIEDIREENPEMYIRITALHCPDVVRDSILALEKDYSFKERLGRRWTKIRSWLRF